MATSPTTIAATAPLWPKARPRRSRCARTSKPATSQSFTSTCATPGRKRWSSHRLALWTSSAASEARNDYTLMALWEMGLRGLRVPIQDLQDARTRRRMEIMTDVGHFFHVYLYGLPNSHELALLAEHRRARLSAGTRRELGRDRRKHRAPAVSFRRHPAPNHSVTRQPEGSRQACRRPVQSSDKPWLQLLRKTGELARFLGAHRGLVAGAQFSIPRSISPWQAGASLQLLPKRPAQDRSSM